MTTHPSLRRLSSLLLVITALLLVTLTVTADAMLLKDINPGTSHSFPRQFVDFGDGFLFRPRHNTLGPELWITDGTTDGTQILKDIAPGIIESNVYSLTKLTDSLVIFNANDGSSGSEVWKTDGTADGTVRVKDICPGSCSGTGSNYPYGVMGGIAYFAGFDGLTKNGTGHGSELWRSDGTSDGTYLVKDIYTTADDWDASEVHAFTPLGNQLFFVATDTTHGEDVWVTDGTESGTHIACDLAYEPDHLTVLGNWLFFQYSDGSSYEVYRTQGSGCEQTLPHFYISADDYAILNGVMYLNQYSDTNFNELWRTDLTSPANTYQVKDIWGGSQSSWPKLFATLGNYIYFVADQDYKKYLWKSDGTDGGTTKIVDFNALGKPCIEFVVYDPSKIINHNGRLYFWVTDKDGEGCTGNTHTQLWSTDAAGIETRMEADIYPATFDNNPDYYEYSSDSLILAARTTAEGIEPWIITLDTTPPPTSVPVSASNLTALPLSATQVQLTWQDNSDNEQGFHIFRGDGVTWSDTPLATANKDATTYTDTTAGCGTKYYYRVMAYNVLGPALMPTNTASATTPVCVPAAPTNVAVKAASQVRATVSWKPGALGLCPTSGNWVGCSPVQGYLLERKPDGGDWAQIVRLPSRSLSFSDGSLACNSAYSYRLRATNTSGESAYSSVVDVTSLACAAPPKPAWVRLTNLYARGYMLSWQNVEGETSYVVQRARNGGAWADWTTLDQDRTSLLIPRSTTRTVTYTYRVRAVNAYGESTHAQVGTSSGLR